MEKKFILTDRFVVSDLGKKLFQIKCVKTFEYANAGDLGGYVEKEENLSQNGDAWICDNAWVSGNALVSDNAQVSGDAWVYGNAHVAGDAQVSADAWVYGNAWVAGNAQVSGDAWICSKGSILGNAYIDSDDKHCGFDCFGSENRHTHAYMTTDGEIEITCGCFRGNLEEFEKQVEATHKGTIYEKQYKAIIELIKIKLGMYEKK